MVAIVYMVAGMSSRFGGMPKQMAQIGPNHETLIEYSVNQALTQPFSELIFITNARTEYLFQEIFKNEYKNTNVKYIQQKYDVNTRSRPWGTTDAVCSLLDKINDSFILVNGDDIYGEPTFKTGFEKMQNPINIIGGLSVKKTINNDGEVNRGILTIYENKVNKIEEKLNISRIKNPELMDQLANVNFIGLQYEILKDLKTILDDFKKTHENNAKIECFLTDNLNVLLENKKINIDFFEIKENIIGITNPEDAQKVKTLLSRQERLIV